MADITKDLRTHLLSKAAVSTLVGTRIYPDMLPVTPTLPACTIASGGGEDFFHLSGQTGMVDPVVMIDCYATTRSAANALYDAVRGVVKQIGRTTIPSTGTLFINSATIFDRGYRVDKEKADADRYTIRYIRTMEIDVVHAETPTT